MRADSLNHAREYPAAGFIDRLVAAGSVLGQQLRAALDMSLSEYLSSLMPAPASRTAMDPHRERLLDALEVYLTERGEDSVESVCDHLARIPVIQQADHSNLLLDPETFLNNVLFHKACEQAGAEIALTSQCSTVTCLWKRRPLAGPVFLRTRGAVLSVFGLSKRKAKLTTFCRLPPPLTMEFKSIEGAPIDPESDPLLGLLAGRRESNAPEAYRRANDDIWRALAVGGPRRVAVDESLVSECAARHALDESSPVHRLLFDPQVRDCFLEVKRELVASPANLAVNHAAPDFLWVARESHLSKVVVDGTGDGARLTHESDGSPVAVRYEPEAVAAALRAGTMYVDRVLAYTIRCILPGVVAVGGTSQQDYVRLYCDALLETDRRTPFLDERDARRVGSAGLSRLGGMPLVELDERGRSMLDGLRPGAPVDELLDGVLDRPVGETIGTLHCADYFKPVLDRIEGVTA